MLFLVAGLSGLVTWQRNSQHSKVPILHPGASFKGAIARGQSHPFVVRLAANRYARIEIEQFEIDLDATVIDQSNGMLVRSDGSDFGREIIS